LNTGIKRGPS